MKPVIRCMILVVLLGCFGCNRGERNPEAEAAAVAVADAWLALVDSEQYDKSWEEAAGIFRGAIPEERWIDTMQSMRKPMGKTLSREMNTARYHTSLPGVPDGEYVIVQYRSAFDNKSSAIETVTPMREADGEWRVSGYYIQ